mmetsp:Transcript_12347/g.42736  ORF Transcript_12347/g.42736 Transcript_12347/m.42736 type:complete len:226 (-) Transcript_12347:21-698(-)
MRRSAANTANVSCESVKKSRHTMLPSKSHGALFRTAEISPFVRSSTGMDCTTCRKSSAETTPAFLESKCTNLSLRTCSTACLWPPCKSFSDCTWMACVSAARRLSWPTSKKSATMVAAMAENVARSTKRLAPGPGRLSSCSADGAQESCSDMTAKICGRDRCRCCAACRVKYTSFEGRKPGVSSEAPALVASRSRSIWRRCCSRADLGSASRILRLRSSRCTAKT